KAIRNVQQALMNPSLKKDIIDSLVKMQNGGAPPAKPAAARKPAAPAAQGAQQPTAAPAAASAPAAPAAAQKPAGQPAAQPAKPAQQAAAPAKPAPAQKPAAQAPVQQKPAAAAPPSQPPADDRDALVQRLNVILKQATGAKDDKSAWRHLPLLAGVNSPNEVPTAAIKLLGPALQQVVKKAAKLENGEIKDV